MLPSLPQEPEIRLLWLESTPRAGQSSAPESSLGMCRCRWLENFEIRLLWLESTPRAGQFVPESPLGTYCCPCLKNLTEIRLLWLESTPRAPFDDVSSPSASKWHI